MKLTNYLAVFGTICLIVSVVWFCVHPNKVVPDECEHTESKYSVDTITREFLIEICSNHNVDHCQPFSVACANCGDIHFVSYSWKSLPDAVGGILVNMTTTPEGVFCFRCGYQLGTDWDVYRLNHLGIAMGGNMK